jgi:ABC-type multidrug transport system fused ATPase/permease subunit
LLDVTPDHDSASRGILWLPPLHGQVRFERVSFSYSGPGEKPALDDLDFTIQPGEVVGVVGRSGSGKSSLIKLLLGLKRPDRGTIQLDGYDTRDVIPESIRRQIGVVTQDAQLVSGTIFDNIACGRLVSKEAVWAAAKLAGAYEFIAELPHGFQTHVGERGVGLSGGQRQRLIIARALVRNPRVLVFDEATASLDPLSERVIHDQLAVIAEGRTTIIISHRIATLRHADRIVVLEAGRIVESGAHEELVTRRGLYWELSNASPEWPSNRQRVA